MFWIAAFSEASDSRRTIYRYQCFNQGDESGPTRFSSCMSERKSTIIGAISSSYVDDVSIKVYRTEAATIARLRGDDRKSSCTRVDSASHFSSRHAPTYLKLRQEPRRCCRGELANTRCFDIPNPVVSGLACISSFATGLSICSVSFVGKEWRPKGVGEGFKLCCWRVQDDLLRKYEPRSGHCSSLLTSLSACSKSRRDASLSAEPICLTIAGRNTPDDPTARLPESQSEDVKQSSRYIAHLRQMRQHCEPPHCHS